MQTLKKQILDILVEEYEKNPLDITISSPSLKGAGNNIQQATVNAAQETTPKQEHIAAPPQTTFAPQTEANPENNAKMQEFLRELYSSDETPVAPSYEEPLQNPQFQYETVPPSATPVQEFSPQPENMQQTPEPIVQAPPLSAKEQKKLEKEKQREQKLFEKNRKEAHKRGYDTSVLMQLDDPAEISDLSNEELNQIQASSIVNNDNFYDYIPPEDSEDLKKEPLPKSRIIIIGGLCLLSAFFLFMFFRSLLNLFF